MDLFLIVAGILVIITVSIDILTTTLRMGKGGVISNFVSGKTWQAFFKLNNKDAQSPFLRNLGFIVLANIFASWVLMIWLGFSLIYLTDYNSVVDTNTGIPASSAGKIYFVGYTISSLGNGDLKSGNDTWRLVSNVVSLYGTFFVTLSISYLIPVLSAVIKKRALSGYIYQMGATPDEIIKNGWNGKDFSMLHSHLLNLNTMILEHSERHLAYPVLHYFHSSTPKYSAPLTLAILDEAVTIQEVYDLDHDKKFNWSILRQSLTSFLDLLAEDGLSNKKIEHHSYREALGSFTIDISEAEEIKRLEQHSQRRERLAGLIKRDGWTWQDLTGKIAAREN